MFIIFIPVTVDVVPHDRRANARDSFCLASYHWCVLKYRVDEAGVENIHQARQAGRVQFTICPNVVEICGCNR